MPISSIRVPVKEAGSLEKAYEIATRLAQDVINKHGQASQADRERRTKRVEEIRKYLAAKKAKTAEAENIKP